jgi:hypothetical protein
MILEKIDECRMCGKRYATQLEYDFQVCDDCDEIPPIEIIESGSFSTIEVAAMAKRITDLEQQLEAANAQIKELKKNLAAYKTAEEVWCRQDDKRATEIAQLTAANARVEGLEGLAYSVLDAVAVADGRSIECYGRRYQIPGSIRDALEALAAARSE